MGNLKTALELIKENIGWFFAMFVDILSRPRKRFAIARSSSKALIKRKTTQTARRIDLSPKIWIFGLFNIVAGTLMFGASVDLTLLGFSKIVVATLACWTIYGSLLHGVCKLIGGLNTYERTLAVSFQVLSVAFFLSSFVGFIVIRAIDLLASHRPGGPSDTMAVAVIICVLVQFLLLLGYWTMGLTAVHRLRPWRAFIFIPLGVIVFMVLNFLLFGMLFIPNTGPFNPHT